ncbi:MAG TPA: Ig-like domain-containing protein [Verrucomicrobiota bacterium]|nr:Ig-like domain-containing protein [Verrucomicrobiota bacterium]
MTFIVPNKFWLPTRIALAGLLACVAAASDSVQSQGFNFSGVTEGGTVGLFAGTATTNLAVTATPSVFTGSTNVVFTLEYQGSVIVNRTSPPPYSTTFTNLAAGKYFLTATLAAAGSSLSSDVSFDIAANSLQPANDHWAGAALIPAVGITVSATNHQATGEANEPMHGGAAGGRSVWWKWTANFNGPVTATTRGSGPDTVLAVYTGTNLVTLLMVDSNNDAGLGTNVFSQVNFNAVSGTEYFFVVDGAVTESGFVDTGVVQLRLLASSPPTVTVTSPFNGIAMVVSTDTTLTNTAVTVTVTDPSGVAGVEYWFDGGGLSSSGSLSPPYQFDLTNLVAGDYWLSFVAANNDGLITVAHTGFAVIPLGARLVFADMPALTTSGFRFAFTGLRGSNYYLQASTNLDVWCSTTSFTNFSGVAKVTDTNAATLGRLFYRAVAE